jgi:hypothetical protein
MLRIFFVLLMQAFWGIAFADECAKQPIGAVIEEVSRVDQQIVPKNQALLDELAKLNGWGPVATTNYKRALQSRKVINDSVVNWVFTLESYFKVNDSTDCERAASLFSSFREELIASGEVMQAELEKDIEKTKRSKKNKLDVTQSNSNYKACLVHIIKLSDDGIRHDTNCYKNISLSNTAFNDQCSMSGFMERAIPHGNVDKILIPPLYVDSCPKPSGICSGATTSLGVDRYQYLPDALIARHKSVCTLLNGVWKDK